MNPKFLKLNILLCISFLASLFLNCNSKNTLDNEITITIKSIDKESLQPRINKFDTVEVRKEGIGILKKTFNKVGEYVTDSTASVKIKIDTTKIYDISVSGLNASGGNMYYPGHLKDNQEIDIQIITYKK